MRTKLFSLAADDIFISYSRKDANTYAVGLADQLTKMGFACFFDRLGTDADRNLPPSLMRKIKKCTMLVLVGTSAAAKSKFVGQEITEFAEANGTSRIVPIDFNAMASADWYSMVVGIAPEIEDISTLESGNPSASVVSRIEKSFNYTRSKDRLRRSTIGAAAVLVILVAASVVAAFIARGQFAQARQARLEADAAKTEAGNFKAAAAEQERLAGEATDKARAATIKAAEETARAQKAEGDATLAKNQALTAKNEADNQKRLADISSKKAETERLKAEAEARNAKASSLVSIARGMTNSDPLTASLLLLESEGSTEPSEGVAAARELLDRYVTKTVLRGHVKSADQVVGIYSIAYSSDGKHVVTSGSDHTVRIWSTEVDGDCVVLRGHEGAVVSAQFSPDGKRVVTASVDGTVRIWNSNGSGKPIVLSGSHSGSQRNGVVFSPDGSRILIICDDDAVRIWNSDGSGTPIVLKHPKYVACAVFSPDGKLVATGSGDHLARIWHADGAGEPMVLKGHDDTVIAADFSPDGKLLVTGALGIGGARVWRVDGVGEPIVLGNPRTQVQVVRFSPDSKKIALGIFRDGPTVEIRTADGKGDAVFISGIKPGGDGPPHNIMFSQDAQRLLLSWHGGNAEIWNADGTGQPIILRGNGSSLSEAVFSPDEREVATASYDGAARIWIKSNRDEPVVLDGAIGSKVHFSSDGKRILATVRLGAEKNENAALLWNADGAGEPIVLRGHQDSVYTANFSSDGSKVVTGSYDGTARVWRSDGQGSPVVLAGHGGSVEIAKFSPDGEHILTVNNRVGGTFANSIGTLRVWRSDGIGDPLVLKVPRGMIESASFSPDSKQIITSGDDGTLRIWSVDGSSAPIVLKGHEGELENAQFDYTGKRVASVSSRSVMIQNVDGSGKPVVWQAPERLKDFDVSPDGKRIVIRADQSKKVYLWNVDGRTEPQVLLGHTNLVNSVRFSNDSKYIITTSYDGSARIWLADGTGEPLTLQTEVGSEISWAELSPDNSRAVTVSHRQYSPEDTARLWTVGWNELVKELRRRTGECLTPEQRTKYLDETDEVARARYSQCDHRFGRKPTNE